MKRTLIFTFFYIKILSTTAQNFGGFEYNALIYDRFPLLLNREMPSILTKDNTFIRYYDLNGNIVAENKYLPYVGSPNFLINFSLDDLKRFDRSVNFEATYNLKNRYFELKESGLRLNFHNPFVDGYSVQTSEEISLNRTRLIDMKGFEVPLLKDLNYEIQIGYPISVINTKKNIRNSNENMKFNAINFNGKKIFNEDLQQLSLRSPNLLKINLSPEGYARGSEVLVNANGENVLPKGSYDSFTEFSFGVSQTSEIISSKEKINWKGVLNYVPGVNTKDVVVKYKYYFINEKGEKLFEIPDIDNYFVRQLEFGLFLQEKRVKRKENNANQGLLKSIIPTSGNSTEKNEFAILNNKGEKIFTSEQAFASYAGDFYDKTLLVYIYETNKFYVVIDGNTPSEISSPFLNAKSELRGFYSGLLQISTPSPNGDCNVCNNGFLDIKGNLVIPAKYRWVSNAMKNRILVYNSEFELELINFKGELVKNLGFYQYFKD